jgi:hypothetical protein
MDRYVAGEFYDKYCMDDSSDISRIIIVEYHNITKIIDFYSRNTAIAEKTDKLTPEQENEFDETLENIEKDYKKDPHAFLKALKKIGQQRRFFKCVINFDKQNAMYQVRLEEKKQIRRRERQLVSYALAVGTLFGIMMHQFWIMFMM